MVVARGKAGTAAVAGISEVTVNPAGVVDGGTIVTDGAVAVTAAEVTVTTAATLDGSNGPKIIGKVMGDANSWGASIGKQK